MNDPLANALAMDHAKMCVVEDWGWGGEQLPGGFGVVCHYCRRSYAPCFLVDFKQWTDATLDQAVAFREAHLRGEQ